MGIDAKHTPGPWTFVGPSPGGTCCDDGGDYAIIQDGGIIAETIHHVDIGRDEDARANAALIAAAPDLLAAAIRAEQALLKMHAQRIWNERHSWDSAKAEEFANNNPMPEVSQLRAAIAKAKGQTEL